MERLKKLINDRKVVKRVNNVEFFYYKSYDNYISLIEAMEKNLLNVLETEKVNTLIIEYKGKIPVVVTADDVFLGGKQNRKPKMSVIIKSGKYDIPVFCIEKHRWHYYYNEYIHRLSEIVKENFSIIKDAERIVILKENSERAIIISEFFRLVIWVIYHINQIVSNEQRRVVISELIVFANYLFDLLLGLISIENVILESQKIKNLLFDFVPFLRNNSIWFISRKRLNKLNSLLDDIPLSDREKWWFICKKNLEKLYLLSFKTHLADYLPPEFREVIEKKEYNREEMARIIERIISKYYERIGIEMEAREVYVPRRIRRIRDNQGEVWENVQKLLFYENIHSKTENFLEYAQRVNYDVDFDINEEFNGFIITNENNEILAIEYISNSKVFAQKYKKYLYDYLRDLETLKPINLNELKLHPSNINVGIGNAYVFGDNTEGELLEYENEIILVSLNGR
jgi:hypothetical protein